MKVWPSLVNIRAHAIVVAQDEWIEAATQLDADVIAVRVHDGRAAIHFNERV